MPGMPARRVAAQTAQLLSMLLLCYAVFVAIVPLSPDMPQESLDPSWREAMNKAAADHLVFGRDIVFTYGPYAGVATQMYEPALRVLTLIVSACYALAAAIAGAIATRSAPNWLRLLLALTLLAGLANRDVLLLVYPLVVVAAVEPLTRTPAQGRRRWFLEATTVCALAAPLGLLPLVKISALPAVGLAGAVLLYVLLRRRRWTDAACVIVASAAGAVAAWCAIGQPLGALVDYVTASLPVITGYSNAMGAAPAHKLVAQIGPAAFLIGAAAAIAVGFGAGRTWERRAITIAFTGVLFVVWKAAFVRADIHMEQGTEPLLIIAALVLPWLRRVRWRWCIAMSIVVAATCVYRSAGVGHRYAEHEFRAATVGLLDDVTHDRLGRASLDRRYEAAHRRIAALPLPEARGTVDLYPFELGRLFARSAQWDPRPVVQSYAAYTPSLARLNADHLASARAPQTVLFQVGAIDGRLPANDDGASWLPLLEHYDLSEYDPNSNYLRFEHRAAARHYKIGRPIMLRGSYGKALRLPMTRSGWIASITIRPTLLGKLRGALWAPPALSLSSIRTDGSAVVSRFIPGGAEAPFLLSPLVLSTADFGGLVTTPTQTAAAGRVAEILLGSDDNPRTDRQRSMFWSSGYTVRLWPIDLASPSS